MLTENMTAHHKNMRKSCREIQSYVSFDFLLNCTAHANSIKTIVPTNIDCETFGPSRNNPDLNLPTQTGFEK